MPDVVLSEKFNDIEPRILSGEEREKFADEVAAGSDHIEFTDRLLAFDLETIRKIIDITQQAIEDGDRLALYNGLAWLNGSTSEFVPEFVQHMETCLPDDMNAVVDRHNAQVDKEVPKILEEEGIDPKSFQGQLAIASLRMSHVGSEPESFPPLRGV